MAVFTAANLFLAYARNTTTFRHCKAFIQESKIAGDPQAYVGNFRCDSRHGLGVAIYTNGEEYAGEFQGDIAEGYGVASLGGTSGTYEGEWRSGTRHGWAVSTLSNKSMWAGKRHWLHCCAVLTLYGPYLGCFHKMTEQTKLTEPTPD